jgi:hypothetical protein
MTFWKVPGQLLISVLCEIIQAKLLGFEKLAIEFRPELESQLFSRGFKVSTIKLPNNYYTVVDLK